MSIKIDPVSGLKVFNTRAAKASEKITGKGYSTITDEALKTLPQSRLARYSTQKNRQSIRPSKKRALGLLTI